MKTAAITTIIIGAAVATVVALFVFVHLNNSPRGVVESYLACETWMDRVPYCVPTDGLVENMRREYDKAYVNVAGRRVVSERIVGNTAFVLIDDPSDETSASYEYYTGRINGKWLVMWEESTGFNPIPMTKAFTEKDHQDRQARVELFPDYTSERVRSSGTQHSFVIRAAVPGYSMYIPAESCTETVFAKISAAFNNNGEKEQRAILTWNGALFTDVHIGDWIGKNQ